MLTQDDLDRLIDAMGQNGVTFLNVEGQDKEGETTKLRLARAPASFAVSETTPISTTRRIPVSSPAIGTYAPRGAGDGLDTLTTGAIVLQDEVLGYVTRGALCIPLVAPESGRLICADVKNGRLIGYGDPVFELEVNK